MRTFLLLASLASDPPLPGDPVEGWSGLGDTDPAPLLTADDAVQRALAAHPDLRAAAAEVDAARAQRLAATRLPTPRIEGEAIPPETVAAAVSLDLTELVTAPGRARLAAASVDVARVQARARAAGLAHEVRVAVYELQAAEEELGIAQQALDAQAAARDAARALHAAGNLSARDTLAREASYEAGRLAVAGIEERRNRARLHLEALVPGPWSVAPLDPSPTLPPPADAEARAVAASLELAALGAELGRLEREAATARAWPEVEIGVRAEREATLPWIVGGTLELTLPALGQAASGRAAAQARLTAARARAESAALATRAAARLAVARVVAADALAAHLRDVVLPLHARLTAETLLHYNAMQVGLEGLLDARRAELDAARAEVEARRAAWVAHATLDAVLAGVRVDAPLPAVALPDSPPSGGHP